MQISFSRNRPYNRSQVKLIFFFVFWLAGFLFGMVLAVGLDGSFLSSMRPTFDSRVSIIRQFAALLLPFLIAAFAAYANKPWLLYLLCFFKACVFIYCGMAVYCAYGSAGWLVRIFVQFSDIVTLPVFCWFCLQILRKNEVTYNHLIICIIFAAMIVCVEHFAVLPFTAQLID